MKTTHAGVCEASLSNPFSLKSAVKADFLTLEPSRTPSSQESNSFPKGSLSIALQNEGYTKEQTTKATIGNGNIRTGSTQVFDTTTGNLISSTGGILNDSNFIAGLNRNINETQVITKDTITGALDIDTTIDLRLLDITGKGQKQIWNELKRLPDNLPIVGDELIKLGQKAWASPNTVLGLAYGGAGYLYGLATGQDVSVNIGNNAIQFVGNPLGQNGGALTLGNSINYFGDARPDSGKTFNFNDEYYTYQYRNNPNHYPFDSDKIILGAHENPHTYHYEILGPLFLPVYFLSGGISHNNWFEKQADKAGNQAYLNWKYNDKK